MIPRPEHPRPQFRRDSWTNLNGSWAFEIDNARSGAARGLSSPEAKLSGRIIVPFCPESSLSGVEHKDFMQGVWYQRTVTLTRQQLAGRVFLHFGAVDYQCIAYVNGQETGRHTGGYTSFRLEITDLVREGENVITVNALDDTRDPMVPRGKQCELYHSEGCDYTRTTGIWQTVWLEFTPKEYIKSLRCEADPSTGTVLLSLHLEGRGPVTAEAFYEGKPVGHGHLPDACGETVLSFTVSEVHLWEPGAGRLYDLELDFGDDKVCSYFGLRSISMDGVNFRINGKSLFQRLVLDQGFYPDGIYTAASDAALQRDIDLAMVMGFNGARLHEKIFEERFLYHCDRKGYLVWGEFPNWGLDHTDPMAIYSILPQWLEALHRDRNHPAIVCWCPFNETMDYQHRRQYDDLIRTVYEVTKSVDPSRPCVDASGCVHVRTDIFDVHDYRQDAEKMRASYEPLVTEGRLYDWVCEGMPDHHLYAGRQKYTGGPAMVSEYGGIRWQGIQEESDSGQSWGYGMVKTQEDFLHRYKGLTDVLLDNPCISGFCYTQLTDIEQEQNGLYFADRTPKLDPKQIFAINSRKAAIED